MSKLVLIRTTTIPGSIRSLLSDQLKFMSSYFDVIAISSGGQEYEKMIEEQQVRGYIVPFTRKTYSIWADIKAFFKLIKIFRKEKPFIVHSHTSKDGLLCMVAAWLCRVPNRLYTIAGLADLSGMRGRLLDLAEWVTFACATGIYPNSKNMMEIYLKKGMFKASKAKVLLNGSSNGIDVDYFSESQIPQEKVVAIRNQFNCKPETMMFVFIGRVTGDKGVNELIQAFGMLSKDNVDVKLMIVGSYEKELDPVAAETQKEIEINENIVFVGFQSDVRPYILAADALILPSYREGMPNVVMQAGALNRPCIVTNINGSNEIIIEGKNGNIVPRKDTQALYNMMKTYCEDNNKVKEMGRNARELIVSRYRRQDLWDAMLKEYQSLK